MWQTWSPCTPQRSKSTTDIWCIHLYFIQEMTSQIWSPNLRWLCTDTTMGPNPTPRCMILLPWKCLLTNMLQDFLTKFFSLWKTIDLYQRSGKWRIVREQWHFCTFFLTSGKGGFPIYRLSISPLAFFLPVLNLKNCNFSNSIIDLKRQAHYRKMQGFSYHAITCRNQDKLLVPCWDVA